MSDPLTVATLDRSLAVLEKQTALIEGLMNRVASLETHYADLVARQQALTQQCIDRLDSLEDRPWCRCPE